MGAAGLYQSTGTKFGCGTALCGACTVRIDGEATRSCVTPVSSLQGQQLTTIEGLPEKGDYLVQKGWVQLNVSQCNYCQSGQVMSAAMPLGCIVTSNR
jgi:isoquinoline 1-oxidoreductase subunit alpha